jgi:P pilus assembly chaperone PapD
MSLQLKEWLVYIGVLIISLALLITAKPKVVFEPVGIALPMSKATMQQIVKSPSWKFPGMPKAWINMEYHVTKDSKAADDFLFRQASVVASHQSPSGFMMSPAMFFPSKEANGMMSVLIGRGYAIK